MYHEIGRKCSKRKENNVEGMKGKVKNEKKYKVETMLCN